MREVAVAGVGMTPFGVYPERRLEDLIHDAGSQALADAGIWERRREVEALYVGNFSAEGFNGQNHLAPIAARALGLGGIPATRTEGACASSGIAFREAALLVAGGVYEMVLVVGVEKMNALETPGITRVLGEAAHAEEEAAVGATFPSLFAMIARRHMHQYGTTREMLSAVAVKNHRHGLRNPRAHMRKEITLEKAMAAAPICEPLNLYDCSLISDGAAAALVTTLDRARGLAAMPIRVLGAGQASDAPCLHHKPDITVSRATRWAAERAFAQAGLGPGDVSFAEVHDCFTIAEILATEDLGLVEKGKGGPAVLEGATSLGGRIPVNVSGGLKSKGHPVGATGVAQIVEAVTQLRGDAGDRQIEGARVGLTHNLGGSGATCTVHLFGRA
ncbi:MAG: thiolase domain-containing protein [Deltaproteobacteria bacterium]|nr:thiolase domain-containing protein [Deltaproteobacteria bacterium]